MIDPTPGFSVHEIVELLADCIDYMEHHASNTSEEETLLVIRWDQLRVKLAKAGVLP